MIKSRARNKEKIVKRLINSPLWNNQFSFLEITKNVKPSFFGLPILINKKFLSRKKQFFNFLKKKGIETRIIIGGNFVNQTSVKIYNLNSENGARIVNVASDAHFGASLDFNDLQGVNPYDGYPNYQRSKLMNILFSYELADRLKDKPIRVNCLHPGFVASKFGHNNSGMKVVFLKIAQKLKAITMEEGAETSIYLSSSSEVEETSGKYFYKKMEKQSSPESRDKNIRKKLWDVTEELLVGFS